MHRRSGSNVNDHRHSASASGPSFLCCYLLPCVRTRVFSWEFSPLGACTSSLGMYSRCASPSNRCRSFFFLINRCRSRVCFGRALSTLLLRQSRSWSWKDGAATHKRELLLPSRRSTPPSVILWCGSAAEAAAE